ncbi:M20 family metallopeptidase [Natronosalvus halobius]|uniref:M20 family metallopeptidase n=1 Tax=Natronosalvus halobius TaxID=2953746 RepID=UPI00209E8D49|nr:M20/M25/M40 family metallo-hydrolase [Natronosalvus halobius]USZ73410.1 M20/M25/M40 family metallo-hydrolase [Natronosalvus halobius]
MSVRELTRDLVSIPSHQDEGAAGDYVEDWLRRETDANVTRDEVGNVIARRGEGGASLALVGHHDVVAPAPSQLEGGGYVVDERDGRLYGRGAADMKGAVAAAMLAFQAADPAGELVFASFVGEEVGGVGARHAIEHDFAPDYAVVGEGSTNYSRLDVTDVAVAHRGRRGSTITARGTAAHASEPDAGENAIYRAVDAVDAIRNLEPPTVEVAGEPLEGHVTATEIDGGSGINVVPDSCTLTVDERTVPGERVDLESVAALPGVEWTVDQDLPPMRCEDDGFAERVLEVARAVQLDASNPPELVTKPHATDAGWLAQAGTECVVYGPSEPGEAHTATESVSIRVLERCLETYQRLASTGWKRGG